MRPIALLLLLALGTAGGCHRTPPPPPGRGCLPEFGSCSVTLECAPPLVCVSDPSWGGGSNLCEQPCARSEDCVDPIAHCVGGSCERNLCQQVGSACDAATIDSGTCVPRGSEHPACSQGGTASATCDVAADRKHPELLCPPGAVCVPVDGGGACAPGCVPNDRSSCPDGMACLAVRPEQQIGGCFPAGPNGCLFAAPGDDFSACDRNSDCLCPAECRIDPVLGRAVCARSCTLTSECPLPTTTCGADSGFCEVATCPTLFQPCASAGLADGTCLPSDIFLGAYLDAGICVQGGTSVATCNPIRVAPDEGYSSCLVDGGLTVCVNCVLGGGAAHCPPQASRFEPTGLCPLGTFCGPEKTCVALCDDGSDGGTCPGGQRCIHPFADSALAGCFGVAASGCLVGVGGQQFYDCSSEVPCACPLLCTVDDAFSRGTICEAPCQETADCADPTTSCQSGTCRTNFCVVDPGGHPVAGSYYETCNASAPGDGTCLPSGYRPRRYGICVQGGSATTFCGNDSFSRTAPSMLCVPGSFCGASGACAPVCNPNAPSSCAHGAACLPIDRLSDIGVCDRDAGC